MKKKIAFFTTGWSCEILMQFLEGLQEAVSDEKVDIFLFLCYPTYVDPESHKRGELNIYSLPDLNEFDGTVIFGSGLNFKDTIDSIVERSKAAGIPVIIQGDKHEEAYYVGSDNYVATRSMMDHLQKEHNVHDIIFFAGSKASLDSEIRLQAVKDHLAEEGRSGDLREVFYTKWENALATNYLERFVNAGKKLPDVFICANDGLAMETCVTLNNLGFKVPDDVRVTGYDFLDDGQIFDPSLATVDQCFGEMGKRAGRLWLDLLDGKESEKESIIPCRFVPGESCGCFEHKNSDQLRRNHGREKFKKRTSTTYFNRKLNIIDSTVLSCLTYQDFKDNLHNLFKEDHYYEGDSFHVLLEPNFGLSIYDRNIKLRTEGYSNYMEVLYSSENGVVYDDVQFHSKGLIPGYSEDDPNHLYAFLPIHENREAYGYLVFRDCLDKIDNHFLQTYQSRFGLVLDKFRHALSLDLLNKRLLELMRRDPLTNVNNRTAYDDKEKYLQSLINSGTKKPFAIAMFDVNNLKLINDSAGHDAGDSYLVRSCHLICDIFKHSPVFRMGGDEFVAVLTGDDYDNREILKDQLSSKMSDYSETVPLPDDYISIACGISVYDPENDKSVQDVVKRADELMYKNKAKIKGR